MSCAICGKRSDGEYCNLHARAYENMFEGYEKWRRAYSISWREYLVKLRDTPNVGTWVVEICVHLLNEKE